MSVLGHLLKESRRAARLSQDIAALRSYCDVSTIRRYESGSITPSWDAVCVLSEVYQDPGLKYRAGQETQTWQDLFPKVAFQSLPASALHLIAASVELNRNATTLADILADGVVDSTEMDRWRTVLRLVNDQLAACIQILEAGANQK